MGTTKTRPAKTRPAINGALLLRSKDGWNENAMVGRLSDAETTCYVVEWTDYAVEEGYEGRCESCVFHDRAAAEEHYSTVAEIAAGQWSRCHIYLHEVVGRVFADEDGFVDTNDLEEVEASEQRPVTGTVFLHDSGEVGDHGTGHIYVRDTALIRDTFVEGRGEGPGPDEEQDEEG